MKPCFALVGTGNREREREIEKERERERERERESYVPQPASYISTLTNVS